MSISEEIRVSRLLKGLAREELASMAGLSVEDLILIENGFKNPSNVVLFRLASLLSIPHGRLSLALDLKELSASEPEKDERPLIMIIGQYCRLSPEFGAYADHKNIPIRFVEAMTANDFFTKLGIGTGTGELTVMTPPQFIVLDADIPHENYRQTAQSITGVKVLKKAPVFLACGEEKYKQSTPELRPSNIFGVVPKQHSPDASLKNLKMLLNKVEPINAFR